MVAPAGAPQPGAIVAVLAVSGMSASFMQSIVLPIQSELPDLLHASRDDTAWVVTVTLLGAAIATPVAGRLGDMYGKRRIALGLFALLLVGSVIAALSPGLPLLLVGRALQGSIVGIIPLGISILRDVLPEHRVGPAVALMSATLGVGGAVGLPFSAWVSQSFDWHALFWCAGAIGVICSVLILLVVPPSTLRSGGRLDVVGAIGLSVGLACLLIAVSRGSVWGWLSWPTLGLALGGVVILLAWGWFELRTADALVDLRVAARPRVLLTNLASIAMGFALFSSNIVYPQLLELPVATGVGLGIPLVIAGLMLMPSGLTMMAMSPLSAWLGRRVGPKVLLVSGAITIIVAYGLSLVLQLEAWSVLVINVVVGIGIGLGYAAMPTLIMQSVPNTETAAANGLNALMRSLGTSTGAATMGAVLAASSVVVPGVADPAPTLDGFRLAFVLGAITAAIAAFIAAFIPRVTPPPLGEHEALPEELA